MILISEFYKTFIVRLYYIAVALTIFVHYCLVKRNDFNSELNFPVIIFSMLILWMNMNFLIFTTFHDFDIERKNSLFHYTLQTF